jgi:NAD(P)-dependent dehydrogenase (short-subunit alcohol dehydrogenase family)
MGRLLVIGAGGDVGRGVVEAALSAGHEVVAAGRRLDTLATHVERGADIMTGDLSTEQSALTLWHAAQAPFGGIDAVIISVTAPGVSQPLADWTAAGLRALIFDNLLTHFNALKMMLPRLPQSGIFVGIGGGTADVIIPGMSHLSMMQAAQRMMYRGFAREETSGVALKELMLVRMVSGASNRQNAKADWLLDVEVGQHICAILADRERFKGTILKLTSRGQVGRPEDKG